MNNYFFIVYIYIFFSLFLLLYQKPKKKRKKLKNFFDKSLKFPKIPQKKNSNLVASSTLIISIKINKL